MQLPAAATIGEIWTSLMDHCCSAGPLLGPQTSDMLISSNLPCRPLFPLAQQNKTAEADQQQQHKTDKVCWLCSPETAHAPSWSGPSQHSFCNCSDLCAVQNTRRRRPKFSPGFTSSFTPDQHHKPKALLTQPLPINTHTAACECFIADYSITCRPRVPGRSCVCDLRNSFSSSIAHSRRAQLTWRIVGYRLGMWLGMRQIVSDLHNEKLPQTICFCCR